MNELRNAPREIDSLHTLNVWTPYGKLMRAIHDAITRDSNFFQNVGVSTFSDGGPRCWREHEIYESMQKCRPLYGSLLIRGSSVYLTEATVVSITPVIGYPRCWLLVFQGQLKNSTNDCYVPATIAAFYNGEYGRGFAMIPEKEKQQVWG